MQGTSMRWAELKSCTTIEQAQKRLDWAINIQTFRYPVSRLNNQTRIETFPKLLTNQRLWKPLDVNAQLVFDFLAKKKYIRKVIPIAIEPNAQITHFGQKPTIGAKYKEQFVSLILDPINLQWQVFDTKGNKIKVLNADNLVLKRILRFSVFQRA